MDTTTLLIIIVVLLLLFGGGFTVAGDGINPVCVIGCVRDAQCAFSNGNWFTTPAYCAGSGMASLSSGAVASCTS